MIPNWRSPLSPRQFLSVVFSVAAVTATATAITFSAGSAQGAPSAAVVPLIGETVTTETTTPGSTDSVPVADATAPTPPTTAPLEISDESAVVVAAPSTTSAVAFAWTKKTSAACHCRVEFPWAPTVSDTPIESGTAQLILAERSGSPISAALWTAPAPSDAPTVEDLRALLVSIAGTEGTIGDQTTGARTDGSPVLDATLRDGTAVSRVRVFAVGPLAYVMLMGASDGQLPAATFDRFANSFTIL